MLYKCWNLRLSSGEWFSAGILKNICQALAFFADSSLKQTQWFLFIKVLMLRVGIGRLSGSQHVDNLLLKVIVSFIFGAQLLCKLALRSRKFKKRRTQLIVIIHLDINTAQHPRYAYRFVPKDPSYIISGLEIFNFGKCNYRRLSLANSRFGKLPQMQNSSFQDTEENQRRKHCNINHYYIQHCTVNVDSFNDHNIRMEDCHNNRSSFFLLYFCLHIT